MGFFQSSEHIKAPDPQTGTFVLISPNYYIYNNKEDAMNDIIISFFTSDSLKIILLNVLSTFVFTILAWITRRLWLERFLYGYKLQFDSVKIFKNDKIATREINKSIRRSKKIGILAIRGKSFVDSDKTSCIYPAIWEDRKKEIEIIISDTYNSKMIKERSFAIGQTPEEYELSIKTTIEALKIRKANYLNLNIYTHRVELPFRIIILDECLYLFYYPKTGSVHTSKVILYEKESSAYYAFEKYYESIKLGIIQKGNIK